MNIAGAIQHNKRKKGNGCILGWIGLYKMIDYKHRLVRKYYLLLDVFWSGEHIIQVTEGVPDVDLILE